MKAFSYLKNTPLIFALYILSLSLLTFVFTKFYLINSSHLIDQNGHYVLSRVSNGFGPIMDKILKGEIPTLPWVGGIEFLTGRRPFLPYFLIYTNNFISSDFFIIHLFKNLLFGSIIFFVIKNFFKKYNNFFLIISLILIFYIPYNSFINLGTEKEEGWLNYFIIILFFILVGKNKYKSIYLSIVLSMIFLLKGSMFFLTFFIPILFIFFEKNDKFKFLPLITIIIVNISWGLSTYSKSGIFAFGPTGSPMNASNLYMISNNDFSKTYPNIGPDIYVCKVGEIIREKNIKNEKELMEQLIPLSMNYIKENPAQYSIGVLKKIYLLMFRPFKDGKIPKNFNFSKNIKDLNIKQPNEIRFSNVVNKTLFNISLIILFYSLFFKKEKNKINFKIDIYYLAILILYLAPYMVAFLYDRHSTSMYIISQLYLFLFYINNKKKLLDSV